jgi:hypothetical protein
MKRLRIGSNKLSILYSSFIDCPPGWLPRRLGFKPRPKCLSHDALLKDGEISGQVSPYSGDPDMMDGTAFLPL